MQFKIDENLPAEAIDILREAGYDAVSVLDQGLGGKPDHEIAKICQVENRIIITLDLDFADIRAYPPRDYAGLIVLRLRQHDKARVSNVLERLVKVMNNEPIANRLWIVEENRVRVRE
jgi:predicted nuclease of predicted toxin-antitoxin system